MNKWNQIIGILILSISSVFGQVDYNISGFFVNYPIYQKPSDEVTQIFGIKKNMILDISRLRLRPVLFLGNNSRLNIEYELNATYSNSDTRFNTLASTGTKHQLVDLTWNIINEEKVNAIHFIDRLYLRQNFDFGSLTIGRQRISWGTGRIWNPIDLFNPINPANFAKTEKDGSDGISFKWNVGNFTDFEFVYGATKKLKNSNLAMRFRSNVGEYDFSIVSGRMDNIYITGADLAGNLFEAGVRAETLYSFKNDKNDSFLSYIIGIDYQFTSKLYALAEFHFNGEGESNKNNYKLMRLLNGDVLNLAKNYLNITANYLLHPLLTANVSNTLNLDDNSGYVAISGDYSLTESIYTALGTQITYGKKISEYWYLPASFYLKMDIYF